jgi:hypothetical protein
VGAPIRPNLFVFSQKRRRGRAGSALGMRNRYTARRHEIVPGAAAMRTSEYLAEQVRQRNV